MDRAAPYVPHVFRRDTSSAGMLEVARKLDAELATAFSARSISGRTPTTT